MMPPIKRLWQAIRQIPLLERVLLIALGALLLPGMLIALSDLIPIPIQLDFTAYYFAAQAMAHGQSPYDPGVQQQLAAAYGSPPLAAYLYPPIFAICLQPLATLPFPIANMVWFGLNLLWLVLAVRCMTRLTPTPALAVAALYVISILTPAVQHTLELGQVNTLLLLLISAALVAIGRRSRGAWWDILGATLLACATAIKLFPAVFVIVLIGYRRGRALIAYGLAILCLFLLGMTAAGGPATTITWATRVLSQSAGGFMTPNNQSLVAAVARLFRPITVDLIPIGGRPHIISLLPLLANEQLGLVLGYTLSAAVGMISIWLLGRRWIRRPAQIDMAEIAFLILSVLVMMPLVWYHYYTLLLIPYSLSLPYALHQRTTGTLVLGSGILVALQRYWRITAYSGTSLAVSFGTLGVLMLWLAFARLMISPSSWAQPAEDLAQLDHPEHRAPHERAA
jgi:hypothetical protein